MVLRDKATHFVVEPVTEPREAVEHFRWRHIESLDLIDGDHHASALHALSAMNQHRQAFRVG